MQCIPHTERDTNKMIDEATIRAKEYKRNKLIFRALILISVIGFVWFAYDMQGKPYTGDEMYHYKQASMVAHGQLPYRDFTIHYGPAWVMLWGNAYKVTGESKAASRAIGAALWAVFFLSTFFLVAAFAGRMAAVIFQIIMQVFFTEFQMFCIASYMFVLPASLAIILCLTKYYETEDNRYIAAIAGLTLFILAFRVDTAILMTVCVAVMLKLDAKKTGIYLGMVIIPALLAGVWLTQYVPVPRLMESFNDIKSTLGDFHDKFPAGMIGDTLPRMFLKIPMYTPFIMIGIAGYLYLRHLHISKTVGYIQYVRKQHIPLPLFIAVIAMYLNQIFYSCDVNHAILANYFAMILGVYILSKGRG